MVPFFDMSEPTDIHLTEDGLEASGKGRVLILACGALAREILAVMRANQLDHIDLQCLPAIFHNHPEKIVPGVRKVVAEVEGKYDKIFLGFADCGTGGELQRVANELGLEMFEGPHCFAFFQGTEDFVANSGDEFTAFYLTDFLVRQFDAFIWKPLGLAKHPQLRDMYFGNYEKLVYQAQIEDPALKAKAEECAEKLGLAFEYRFTGYGDLQRGIETL